MRQLVDFRFAQFFQGLLRAVKVWAVALASAQMSSNATAQSTRLLAGNCFKVLRVGFLINAGGRTDARRRSARRCCGAHTA